MVVDGSAPHEYLVGIRRHVRRQGGRHQVHRRDALLPRLLLFRKGKAFRRRTLVRHPARFSRRGALQAPRLARTDPDQDARRHRLRHQQRLPTRTTSTSGRHWRSKRSSASTREPTANTTTSTSTATMRTTTSIWQPRPLSKSSKRAPTRSIRPATPKRTT